jgi:cytochrome c oxidase subunit 1
VQLFCWIATLWTGRVRLEVPMLYVLAFFFLFLIGGMSGLFLAAVPTDLQLTDTYFLPAHIHYVLLGGAVFPLLGAIYFWFPKATGRMLDDRLGRTSFWLLFLGMNLTFGAMMVLAMLGMPRRVYTYLPGLGFSTPNLVATIGAGFLALGVLTWVANVLRSLRAGELASADPWGADSLEWTIPSPPPSYNHALIPVVYGRAPAWERMRDDAVVTGLATDRREVLVTSVREARPESRHVQPEPTPWTFVASLATGVTFITLIFTPWGVVIGGALATVALILWFWPRKGEPPSAWAARDPKEAEAA